MLKNQELRKFQRFKNQVLRIKIQDSRIKFQESRFKNNQDQDSRLKIQESREDSIKISIQKVFQNIDWHKKFSKNHYQRVLLSGNRLSEGSNRLPVANIVFKIDL